MLVICQVIFVGLKQFYNYGGFVKFFFFINCTYKLQIIVLTSIQILHKTIISLHLPATCKYIYKLLFIIFFIII